MNDHNMMETNYQKRLSQRQTIARIGQWSFIGGFVLVIVGVFSPYNLIISIGQSSVYFGAVSIVVFSRIGWSSSPWKDFLFNQFSYVLSVVGFILLSLYIAYGLFSIYLSFFVMILSIVLAGLGMLFKSPISEDLPLLWRGLPFVTVAGVITEPHPVCHTR